MYGGCLLCPLYPLLFPTDSATLLHHKIRTSSQLSVCLDPFRIDFVSSRIAPPPPLFLDILKIYLIQSYTIKILNSGLLTKKNPAFPNLVAWVAACPRTRLNHLYSPSALYTCRRFGASATQATNSASNDEQKWPPYSFRY